MESEGSPGLRSDTDDNSSPPAMRAPAKVLVCFAVPEEAAPFRKRFAGAARVDLLVTGMGRANAERAVVETLGKGRRDLVFTCGFAGGLREDLPTGTVLFAGATESGPGMKERLLSAGAQPGRFHCYARVAASADEKRALREATGADAVEMESAAIDAVCCSQAIPCVTLRVILDTATEDLPLDFNALMTADQRLDFRKLALTLVRRPGKIPALLRLQRLSRAAAERLAGVLQAVVR
jgi:adenosylhomocysteine nucleosidase